MKIKAFELSNLLAYERGSATRVVQRKVDALVVEKIELAKKLEKAERDELQTMKERENATTWADKLAYAVGSESEIGEHSNANNPWREALALLETKQELAGSHEYALTGLLQYLGVTSSIVEMNVILKNPAKLNSAIMTVLRKHKIHKPKSMGGKPPFFMHVEDDG